MTPLYRLRWLPTASGYVGQFAGQWADREPTHDRAYLEDLQRRIAETCGTETEIVELEDGAA